MLPATCIKTLTFLSTNRFNVNLLFVTRLRRLILVTHHRLRLHLLKATGLLHGTQSEVGTHDDDNNRNKNDNKNDDDDDDDTLKPKELGNRNKVT